MLIICYEFQSMKQINDIIYTVIIFLYYTIRDAISPKKIGLRIKRKTIGNLFLAVVYTTKNATLFKLKSTLLYFIYGNNIYNGKLVDRF